MSALDLLVKAYVDISDYWPKDEEGKPKTVNSVYQSLLGSPNKLSRSTLKLALEGKLDRGYFSNQLILACRLFGSEGRRVTNAILKCCVDASKWFSSHTPGVQ